MSGEVLCLGNALLDISFFADKTFLEANNLKADDAVIVDAARFKAINEALEARFHASGHVPGGDAQNVARTIQWVLPGEKGTVTYMGAMCPDRIGTLLKEKAEHANINAVYETVDEATGACLVIVTGEHNEHRSLAAHLGGAKKFTVEHLKNNMALVEKAKLFYVEGFFLPTCFEACKIVAKHASENPAKRFAIDLSAHYIATQYKDQLLELMPFVDVIFGNEAEFAAFGEAIGAGKDLATVTKHVAALPKNGTNKRVAICTQGAEPALVSVGGEEIKSFAVPKLADDRIVDRNGAGDAFVGAFLAAFTNGKTLEESVRAAIQVAEVTIQHFGCTFPAEKPCLTKLTSA